MRTNEPLEGEPMHSEETDSPMGRWKDRRTKHAWNSHGMSDYVYLPFGSTLTVQKTWVGPAISWHLSFLFSSRAHWGLHFRAGTAAEVSTVGLFSILVRHGSSDELEPPSQSLCGFPPFFNHGNVFNCLWKACRRSRFERWGPTCNTWLSWFQFSCQNCLVSNLVGVETCLCES